MTSYSLLAQLVASLGGVLGLIWLLSKAASKRGWMTGGNNQAKPIKVVARHVLTKTTSLAVVRVGDRELLLGVGAQGVNVLLDEAAGQIMAESAPRGLRAVSGSSRISSALTRTPARPAMVTEGTAATSGFPSSARTPMLDRLRARTVRH